MKFRRFINNVWVRNLIGLLLLILVHYVSDQYSIERRSGFARFSPYLFLVLLYGWLVFHNRILFERLYLRNQKVAYVGWMLAGIGISSFNMNFVLQTYFGVTRTLPYIVSFWVYTVTGLGVYVLYRYLQLHHIQTTVPQPIEAISSTTRSVESDYLECMVNGERQTIPLSTILYIQSLENYLTIVTKPKTYITRLTLKEAEGRLPKPQFIRISRSHIVNVAQLETVDQDTVRIGGKELRIGKIYKRYVVEQLARQ